MSLERMETPFLQVGMVVLEQILENCSKLTLIQDNRSMTQIKIIGSLRGTTRPKPHRRLEMNELKY